MTKIACKNVLPRSVEIDPNKLSNEKKTRKAANTNSIEDQLPVFTGMTMLPHLAA
jgi:hypothetical protein